jgi:hypothetical protein
VKTIPCGADFRYVPEEMKPCMVCEHPEKATIEDALLRKVACAKLGTQYGLSSSAIWRHKKHLGRSVVCIGERPLLDRLEALMNRLENIAQKAETSKDWKAAIAGMREIRESIELLARLTGAMPLPGHAVTVGVAVNVTAGQSRSDVSNYDLDLQIASSVAEATDNFDQRTIERMKRLVERCTPLDLRKVGDSSGTGPHTALLE